MFDLPHLAVAQRVVKRIRLRIEMHGDYATVGGMTLHDSLAMKTIFG